MLRKGPSKVAMDTLAVTHLGPRDSTYSGAWAFRYTIHIEPFDVEASSGLHRFLRRLYIYIYL